MGTDFTYDDLGEPSVDEDTHKFIKEEEIDGQKCWVVESIPKDEDSRYSKKILWIRQDALLAVKVEYYDRDGNLMKRLTVQDLRKKDGIWTTFEMEMDNIQKKHKTKLIFSDVRYNQGIKDSLFRVSTLERGRIK
jgi:negative regulator of sigma E activity